MLQLLHVISLFLLMPGSTTIFDFTAHSNLREWRVVDDGVMGGWSQGNLKMSSEGHGVFSGEVRLENNGGFSSIRYRPRKIDVSGHGTVIIRLRGDSKQYQFRIKSDKYQMHSYIYNFQTTGQWQTIEIPLKEMTPAFRGRRLNIGNFSESKIEEIAFLISSKQREIFKLEIDKVLLK